MDADRCTCPFVCVCFILASVAIATPDVNKQKGILKCWGIGRTKFRLCVEDYENLLSQKPSLELQFRDFGNDFPSSGLPSLPVSYSRQNDNGEEMVQYFMKRLWNRYNGFPLQRRFPSKDTENMPETKAVKKRPFDSISYNTGFGGFK